MTTIRHWVILCAFALPGVSTAAWADAHTFKFDLPAQSLESSLRAIGQLTHMNVLFDSGLVEGLSAPALQAELTTREAIARLTADTNLSVQQPTPDTITVSRAKGKEARERTTLTAPELKNKPAGSFGVRLAQSGKQGAEPGNGDSSAPAPGASGGPIEEVIVTAQRRVERLQDIPLSVQVLGWDTLVRRNINSIADVSQIAPSVRYANTGRSDNITIRGIGSTGGQSFDQSVGLFVDDIYHGRSRINNGTFLDLERIEILKGPQSTYFGNNAIAGALSLTSKKPTAQFEGWTRALYGEGGQYALEGAVNAPLGERFALRAAGTFNGSDGWVKNLNTGEDQPNQDNMAGRLSFLYRVSDDLEATLKVEGSKNVNRSGLFLQIADCPPPAPFVSAGFCSVALGLGVPIGYDKEENSSNRGQEIRLSTADAVLDVNYQFGDHVLTSTSGFYGYHYNLNLDADVLPVNLVHVQAPEHYKQYSQELRLASPTGGTLEYLAGLYYQTDDLFFRQDQSLFLLTPFLAGNSALAPYLPIGQDVNFEQDEDVYSLFGSLAWNVTDQLQLGAGLRGTWVEKDYVQNLFYATATADYGGFVPLPPALQPAFASFGVPGTLRGERSDHAWMPSAKIQYRLNPSAMVYVSFAKGFKAGGFNGAEVSGVADRVPFGPEYVKAYEAGLKSEWFERKLLLNLAVFHSDYTDLQTTINVQSAPGTFISLVRNAAEARSRGVELEAQWAATENFRVSADVTYLDARYVRFENVNLTVLQSYCRPRLPPLAATADPACAQFFPLQSYPNGIPQFRDRSGDRLFTPKWSGNLAASYRAALPGGYRLTTELSMPFSSDHYQDQLDRWTGANERLDARLTLEPAGGRWAIDVIGKNLDDEQILPFYGSLAQSPGTAQWQAQQPRNVAAQFRYYW